jgi:hypothetical protein
MTIVHAVPRQRPVTAMRVLLHVTTKPEILQFCPRANVGVRTYLKDGVWVDDQRDIRWLMVPHNGDLWDRLENDGDWIVQVSPGHFVTMSDGDFHREYVMQ